MAVSAPRAVKHRKKRLVRRYLLKAMFGAFLLLVFLPSTAQASILVMNGSDGTGGFDPNLNNCTAYARLITPAPFLTNVGHLLGTPYVGTYGYQVTPALSGTAIGSRFIYEAGRSCGAFYNPMNDSYSINFSVAMKLNTSVGAGGTYGNWGMCIGFNVTNASLTANGVVFHWCYLLTAGSALANTSTDLFWSNSLPLGWSVLRQSNITPIITAYMGQHWNVSNVTVTQWINATSVTSTNNITKITMYDAINVSEDLIVAADPCASNVITQCGCTYRTNYTIYTCNAAFVCAPNQDFANFTNVVGSQLNLTPSCRATGLVGGGSTPNAVNLEAVTNFSILGNQTGVVSFFTGFYTSIHVNNSKNVSVFNYSDNDQLANTLGHGLDVNGTQGLELANSSFTGGNVYVNVYIHDSRNVTIHHTLFDGGSIISNTKYWAVFANVSSLTFRDYDRETAVQTDKFFEFEDCNYTLIYNFTMEYPAGGLLAQSGNPLNFLRSRWTIVKDSTFGNVTMAIQLYDSNHSYLSNLSISNASTAAIKIISDGVTGGGSYNNTIYNTTIWNATEKLSIGIQLITLGAGNANVFNNTMQNVSIINPVTGISMTRATNNTFLNGSIINGTNTLNEISWFGATSPYDSLWVINSTVNSTNMSFTQPNKAEWARTWFCWLPNINIYSTRPADAPVGGGFWSVNDTNSSGYLIWNITANPPVPSPAPSCEGFKNGTSTDWSYNETPHLFMANKTGWITCSNMTNVTSSDPILLMCDRNEPPVIDQVNLTFNNNTIEFSNLSYLFPQANISDINLQNLTTNASVWVPGGMLAAYYEQWSTTNFSKTWNYTNFTPNVLGLWRVVIRAMDNFTDPVGNSTNATYFLVKDTKNATADWLRPPTPAAGNYTNNNSYPFAIWVTDYYQNLSSTRAANITINETTFNGQAVANCTAIAPNWFAMACSYIWNTTNVSTGEYWICGTGADAAGNVNKTCFDINLTTAIDLPPVVNLSAPSNPTTYTFTTTNRSFNTTFVGAPFDDHNFTNMSLWLNISGTWQSVITNMSPVNGSEWRPVYNLSNGTYIWNFQVCDAAVVPQCAFNETNYTLTISLTEPPDFPPLVNLNYPGDNTLYQFNTNNLTYTMPFQFTPFDDHNFTNGTLYINISGGWIGVAQNETFLSNGTSSTIHYPLPANGSYLWNVLVYDGSTTPQWAFNSSNRTVNITLVPLPDAAPAVNMSEPPNATIFTLFTENATMLVTLASVPFDDYNFTNLSLRIWNNSGLVANLLNFSALSNGTASIFTISLGNGTYNWSPTVCDAAVTPQCTNNETNWTFTVNLQDDILPRINCSTPLNGSTVSGVVLVNCTVVDPHYLSMNLSINFTNNALMNTTSNPLLYYWNTTPLNSSWYLITVIANDTSGNQQTVTITVYVSSRNILFFTPPFIGAALFFGLIGMLLPESRGYGILRFLFISMGVLLCIVLAGDMYVYAMSTISSTTDVSGLANTYIYSIYAITVLLTILVSWFILGILRKGATTATDFLEEEQ